MSSNDAKRLLQEFVSKYGSDLEVVYTLSGWLKKDPKIYNVRLVPGSKLASRFIASKLASPTTLQFSGVLNLYRQKNFLTSPQPQTNCLKDNRFCGDSNSFVKRIVNGKSIGTDPPKTKIASGIAVPSKTNGDFLPFPTHQSQDGAPLNETVEEEREEINFFLVCGWMARSLL